MIATEIQRPQKNPVAENRDATLRVNPVERKSETLIYWGDLIPTVSHLNLPYLMSYDLFPLQTMEQKERLLDRALKEDWVSFFEHDPKIAIATLIQEEKRIKIKSVIE
jgi:glyoxylase-like metal-dependent hydrolase (beta-lactamase superfamily II)